MTAEMYIDRAAATKTVEIPFVRLETPARVIIGTLGTSPFIVVPEDCYTKTHIKKKYTTHSLFEEHTAVTEVFTIQ